MPQNGQAHFKNIAVSVHFRTLCIKGGEKKLGRNFLNLFSFFFLFTHAFTWCLDTNWLLKNKTDMLVNRLTQKIHQFYKNLVNAL